jgi:hypothetical protein
LLTRPSKYSTSSFVKFTTYRALPSIAPHHQIGLVFG